ncbi:hypothetical protein B0H14DRAFT_2559603 [Mycena olivaceomarginata]|nr:hypothetical protein B0H14DRAFT_2559603 [Mycena olivaceomarginata]
MRGHIEDERGWKKERESNSYAFGPLLGLALHYRADLIRAFGRDASRSLSASGERWREVVRTKLAVAGHSFAGKTLPRRLDQPRQSLAKRGRTCIQELPKCMAAAQATATAMSARLINEHEPVSDLAHYVCPSVRMARQKELNVTFLNLKDKELPKRGARELNKFNRPPRCRSTQ